MIFNKCAHIQSIYSNETFSHFMENKLLKYIRKIFYFYRNHGDFITYFTAQLYSRKVFIGIIKSKRTFY